MKSGIEEDIKEVRNFIFISLSYLAANQAVPPKDQLITVKIRNIGPHENKHSNTKLLHVRGSIAGELSPFHSSPLFLCTAQLANKLNIIPI